MAARGKPFVEPISLAEPSPLDLKQSRDLEQVGEGSARWPGGAGQARLQGARRRRTAHSRTHIYFRTLMVYMADTFDM
jgi:hypothetical protein